ncbi:MAG: glycosyltransferase family 39 protein [Rhodospirillaceae bacterium]
MSSLPSNGGTVYLRQLFDDLSWLWLFGITLLVILTYSEYGIIWDAEVQNEYGKKLLAYYMTGFVDRSAFEYQNLYLYGGAFDLLAAAVNLVSPLGEYETRSLLGGLVGVLGLVATWRLARLLAGERAGFLALVLLTLTPDYYGHMPINPKDMPFACGMTWILYLACRIVAELPKPRLGTVLWLGLVSGVTLGTRVGALLGGAYLGLILLLYLVLVRRDGASPGETLRVAGGILRRLLPGLVLAYVVMGLCWPWAVLSPLNPLVAFQIFSHFTWPNSVLAAGVTFKASAPPLWYLPLMLAVKLPEIVLVGLVMASCSGIGWLVDWHGHRERKFTIDEEGLLWLQVLMVVLAALFPLAYYLVMRPEVYNGIRHFLFMVPPLVVLAGMSLGRLWVAIDRWPLWLHRVALAIFSAPLITQAWIMMELHPNQYIYYNALVGGVKGANGRYELDYWGTSIAQAARELVAYVQNENHGKMIEHKYKVLVCANYLSAMYFLPKQFELTRVISEGDFFIGLTLTGCNNSVDGQQIIRVERLGAVLSVVKDRRSIKKSAVDIADGVPKSPALR